MVNSPRFTRLFEPVRIGDMEVKNRIVMPPMGAHLGTKEGHVIEGTRAYYEERSKGGVGLIIVEDTGVYPIQSGEGRLLIYDDKFIPGLSELAQAIKRHGARAAIQLVHWGRIAPPSKVTGHKPVSASAIGIQGFEPPREMTIPEIKELVGLFAGAARRAQTAGFDGVEIHAAHGYLISQFLSSSSNQRADEYGGSLDNRARFLVEILHAVRESVGPSYPVWCRLSIEYGVEGGITIDELEQMARLAESAGAQAIHVSAYGVGAQCHLGPPTLVPGSMLELAERVKKAVKVPVITVGRISPALAEKVLEQGKADLVAMGRALIADPELPHKLASGKLDEIRPCIVCLECLDHSMSGQNIVCSVNPAAGKELECRFAPADKPKDVLVVGGGPAGMEAAIVAATRGHRVTLCDRGSRLGGALTVGSTVRDELEDLARYLVNQTKMLPINLRLSTEVTPKLVEELKPQVVIVATGGVPVTPEIPGVDGRNVVSIHDIYDLMGRSSKRGRLRRKVYFWPASIFARYFYNPSIIRWILGFGIIFGRRLVIIGGGLPGVELGAFMADKGRKVTVVEASGRAGKGLTPVVRRYLMDKIRNQGGAILIDIKWEKITPRGLTIRMKDGSSRDIEGDTVVLALGAETDLRLFEALKGKAPEVYSIGDCVDPRTVLEAISNGFSVACKI